MPRPSLLDIANFQNVDATQIIEEVITAVPEIALFPWDTIPGQQYRTIVRTSNPTAAFRAANNGPVASKSTFEQRLIECFILNPRWECDKALADIHPKGSAYLVGIEGAAILTAALKTLASQFYYGVGTGGDAAGFAGFLASLDTTNMVVDATGTTASTGSSVWMIKRGEQDVNALIGGNGMLDVSDVRIGDATGQNSEVYTAYIQELLGWFGLQIGNKWSVGRIKCLTADSGKGLTDLLMSQLLEKFPAGHEPDLILMSRRSRGQLQRSRTTYSPTGSPAPMPTEYEGIPIVITESLTDTESLSL